MPYTNLMYAFAELRLHKNSTSSCNAFAASISLGNVANDEGLALQHLRILDPYDIVIEAEVSE